MSIKIELNDESIRQQRKNPVKVQYIPASVDEPNKINIDNFFNNYTEEIDGHLKNSLRGFPLNGCNFKVPESHHGIIFQETQRPLNETDDRKFQVSGLFDEFIYWNYDKVPSENDKLKRALQWNEFAAAIHKPIDPKEFADRFNISNDKQNSQ